MMRNDQIPIPFLITNGIYIQYAQVASKHMA